MASRALAPSGGPTAPPSPVTSGSPHSWRCESGEPRHSTAWEAPSDHAPFRSVQWQKHTLGRPPNHVRRSVAGSGPYSLRGNVLALLANPPPSRHPDTRPRAVLLVEATPRVACAGRGWDTGGERRADGQAASGSGKSKTSVAPSVRVQSQGTRGRSGETRSGLGGRRMTQCESR